jgi:hypothetical protein
LDDQETLCDHGHLPWDDGGRMFRKRPELFRPSVLEGFPKVLRWRKCHGATVGDRVVLRRSVRARALQAHESPINSIK